MSDYNSSLPIRTESAGDAIVKVCDPTVTSQQLAISASGEASVQVTQPLPAGTNNIGDVDVLSLPSIPAGNNNIGDVDVASVIPGTGATNLGKAEDDAHASGDVGVMALAVRQDSAASLVGANGDYAPIQVDAIGNVKAGLYDAAGASFGTVANPVNVAVTDAAGDAIHNYSTAAAIASAATSNHDYTVTALKTLFVKQVIASASGKMKIEIQEEDLAGGGTYTTKGVMFNSTANPNMLWTPVQPLEVEAGKKIRVIRTNKDNQSQDLYSTVIGVEV